MAKQRVMFGEEFSLGRVGPSVGPIGESFELEPPRFGDACVCCDAHAGGRTKNYNASTHNVRVPPVPMPVCESCDDHALVDSTTTLLQLSLIGSGVVIAAVAAFGLVERPGDRIIMLALAASLLGAVSGVLWMRATRQRIRRARDAGHHPRLVFSVASGRTFLETTNERLVETLQAHNAGTQVQPAPRVA